MHIAEINQSFKVLGSELELVESQFDKNDKSVETLTARNEVLEKSIDTQKEKIETLKATLDNASSSFGENNKGIHFFSKGYSFCIILLVITKIKSIGLIQLLSVFFLLFHRFKFDYYF